MDEIAETFEVMHDDELVQDLKDALKEVEEGGFLSAAVLNCGFLNVIKIIFCRGQVIE